MATKPEHTSSSEIGNATASIKELQMNPIMVPISDYLKGSSFFEKEDEREITNLTRVNNELIELNKTGIYDDSQIAIKYKDVISLWERIAWIYKKNVSLANKEIANIKKTVEEFYVTKDKSDKRVEFVEEELDKIKVKIKEESKPKDDKKALTKSQKKIEIKKITEDEENYLRRSIENEN